MNPPRVYTCSQSWTPLPPSSTHHPFGSSQCTSPKHPVSCIKPGLAIRFLYDIHIYMEFRKMVMITLYARQQKRHRCIEQSFGLWERERVGMIWENGIETWITLLLKRSQHFYVHEENSCPHLALNMIWFVWFFYQNNYLMTEKIIQSNFVSEEYFLYVKLKNNNNSSDFCIYSMCGKILSQWTNSLTHSSAIFRMLSNLSS